MEAPIGLIPGICTFAERVIKEHDKEFTEANLNRMVECLEEETGETRKGWDALKADFKGGSVAQHEELIDGNFDTAFVGLATAYIHLRMNGHNADDAVGAVTEGFQRVITANLTKINPDGTVTRDATGKVQKPKGFKKPTYGDILFPAKPEQTEEKVA